MDRPDVCVLCTKRVSNWEMACGKTVIVNDQVTHKACLMDHDISIAELEKRLKRVS